MNLVTSIRRWWLWPLLLLLLGSVVFDVSGQVRTARDVIYGALTIEHPLGTATVSPSLTITEAAHTALTAATERSDVDVNLARTVQWAAGNIALQRFFRVRAPTMSATGASTITDTCTLCISGAPIKSTDITLAKTHGLLIEAGAVSTATDAYGLTVNAPTGATNNYAAVFLGGNVGINTTSPGTKLDVRVGAEAVARFRTAVTFASGVVLDAGNDAFTTGTNFEIRGANIRLVASGGTVSLRTNGADAILQETTGGLRWATGTKPTCAAGIRGTVYYVAGAAGVLDTFEVCRKNAADAYAWVTLF